MNVLLGTNRFADCDTLIEIEGVSILKIATGPLRVTLVPPQRSSSDQLLEVVDNQVLRAADSVDVVASERSVGVFWRRQALVLATLLDSDSVHLRVDLRPLGIELFDDPSGLHVGENVLAANVFEGFETAISVS